MGLFIALASKVRDKYKLHRTEVNSVWRSKLHSDGTMFEGGWFIMGIRKKEGVQVTYHLPLKYWEETDFAETLEKSPKWDGHTEEDVLERIKNL